MDERRLVEPDERIVDAIRQRRVVVLMEAHRAPETRYFGARLLPLLAAAGATHLAFETAAQVPLDRFLRTGVVRPDTEVYAFEPSRAALLRAARRARVRVVAFDFPPEGHLRAGFAHLLGRRPRDAEAINRQREEHMAQNIVRLILARDSQARVVVWAGEQHAMKRTPPDWPWQHPFMAAYLARLAGEEPFCVWQACVDWPMLADGPRLLVGEHRELRERGVDAMVLHHRGAEPARPRWLDRGRMRVHLEPKGAELVQFIPVEEGAEAVPAAQRLTDGQAVEERLPPGSYLVRGLSGPDEVVWERRSESGSF